MIKKHKYTVLVIAIFLLLVYYFNSNLGLLCFCVFFQVQLIIEILKQIRIFQKIKDGVIVDATLTNFRIMKGYEDDVHNYEGTLEFFWPDESKKYQIQHKFSSLQNPESLKIFLIRIDTNNPLKSVVVSRFDISWKLKIIFFLVVLVGLFFVDLILFNKITYTV